MKLRWPWVRRKNVEKIIEERHSDLLATKEKYEYLMSARSRKPGESAPASIRGKNDG